MDMGLNGDMDRDTTISQRTKINTMVIWFKIIQTQITIGIDSVSKNQAPREM